MSKVDGDVIKTNSFVVINPIAKLPYIFDLMKSNYFFLYICVVMIGKASFRNEM